MTGPLTPTVVVATPLEHDPHCVGIATSLDHEQLVFI